MKPSLALRIAISGALATLTGSALWAKSSYETGLLPLLKGGLLGGVMGVAVVLGIAKLAKLRKQQ